MTERQIYETQNFGYYFGGFTRRYGHLLQPVGV